MRYLAAKRSVDDRALNWQVWQRLVAALPRATTEQPLHILEVGAGIGSMVERLLAGDVLTHATYTAIDKAPALLTEAHRRLFQWADDRGFQVADLSGGERARLNLALVTHAAPALLILDDRKPRGAGSGDQRVPRCGRAGEP